MTRLSFGALAPRFNDVRSIAVLRAGGLGDLMFALPAIESLAAAYPDAAITLLGMPAHAALLEGRPGVPIHDVEVVPAAPGVRNGDSDPGEVEAFAERMRQRRFDLAVQAHGGGRNSNPFVLRLGARMTVGTATPDAAALTRTLAYDVQQHEVLRWLEVAGLAGAPAAQLEATLATRDGEVAQARRRLPAGERHLVIHPSASDPRRRWPPERFAAVAAAVVRDGARVHVIGDAVDVPLAASVVAAARELLPQSRRERVGSLAGELSMSELVGVLTVADLLLGNDSGPRHLAQALGTRTVGLFWAGNALNAAPLLRSAHRMLIGWITHCPICGADVTRPGWKSPRCEHDPSYLADIETDDVLDAVRSLLPPA